MNQRITQTINAMQDRYGELVTWRSAGNCLALEIPLALVHEANGTGVDADIALQTLAGLLVPQLDRIPPAIMADALGDSYTGGRGDYLALVKMAVKDLAE